MLLKQAAAFFVFLNSSDLEITAKKSKALSLGCSFTLMMAPQCLISVGLLQGDKACMLQEAFNPFNLI